MADYKETLLIGKTDFEMRAGLSEKEPKIEQFWIEKDIYNKKQKLNDGKPLFILHDGPPYANGSIHVGHALNKTLKDFIIRYKNSTGYKAPFILGWDTHGLPIENAIVKSGVDRKTTNKVEFRKLAEKYALEQIEIQTKGFTRLGVFTDYNKKYVTLTKDYVINEMKLFAKMFEKKLVYRDLKPIYWSPSSESALAEAEIEYKDVMTTSIYVKMEIVEDYNTVKKGDFAVVWTTTPWTIPANQLIAVGENINYLRVKNNENNEVYIIAENLLNDVFDKINVNNYQILATFKGKDITSALYKHPLYENISKIVLGHHVRDDGGTGLVHTATGFGEDDYIIGKNNNINVFAPLNDRGIFTEEINDPDLIGQFYEKTNDIVIKKLEDKNNLLFKYSFSHSYPHDWRTKKPVIYRATKQWFVNIEKVKTQIFDELQKISTNPKWGKQRITQSLTDRKEWVISRQRLWGVPIIAFYDENKELILSNELMNHAIEILAKDDSNSWFENDADYFLPPEFKNKKITKEKDILDVWFDSGSSAIYMEETYPEFKRPFDLYLEGNDQYRGWFNSSMINSVIFDGKSPYKKLIVAGMTNDATGKKMSKSLGNGIDPLKIADELGSDILRLWVASVDYTDDQRIGGEILKQIAETYRKIRNTMRFILANLDDFDCENDYQSNLQDVDKFVLHNLSDVKNKVMNSYDSYNFNNVFNLINNYVIVDLSSFYLDFIKDILYVDAKDDVRRRQVQSVLFEILWGLIDMLRPILVHTTEEVYSSLKMNHKVESIHLLDTKKQDFLQNEQFVLKWEKLIKLRNDINFAIEQARNEKIVKKSFEVEIDINLKKDYEFLENINDLAQIAIVSKINFEKTIENGIERETSILKVKHREGLKCERCWGIFDTLATDDLCQRCNKVVNKI